MTATGCERMQNTTALQNIFMATGESWPQEFETFPKLEQQVYHLALDRKDWRSRKNFKSVSHHAVRCRTYTEWLNSGLHPPQLQRFHDIKQSRSTLPSSNSEINAADFWKMMLRSSPSVKPPCIRSGVWNSGKRILIFNYCHFVTCHRYSLAAPFFLAPNFLLAILLSPTAVLVFTIHSSTKAAASF